MNSLIYDLKKTMKKYINIYFKVINTYANICFESGIVF